MKLIVTRYRDRAELLACYQNTTEHGGLFVPTRYPRTSGEPVVLDVRVPGFHESVMIRGQVAWSRGGRRSGGHRAGMGVEFLPAEYQKRDYLMAMARGTQDASRSSRRHARLPSCLPGCWRLLEDATLHHGTIADISSGGAFLETSELLEPGTQLVVHVAIPGAAAHHAIEGKVVWSSDQPERRGMGVEFRSRDMAGKRRIRELVRRIRESMLASAGDKHAHQGDATS